MGNRITLCTNIEKNQKLWKIYLGKSKAIRSLFKNLKSISTTPTDPRLKENDFDLVLTVGLEATMRLNVKPGV